jgi:hypothetical protein
VNAGSPDASRRCVPGGAGADLRGVGSTRFSSSSVSIGPVRIESDARGGIYACLPKKGIANSHWHFIAVFRSTRRFIRFYCGLDTRYVVLPTSTWDLLSGGLEDVLAPETTRATRLVALARNAMWPIRLAGAVPGGEPDGAESTAESHLAVREKRNGGGGRAAIRCIEIHRPRTSLVGIEAREYTTRAALGK